jgi:hypothetical protein
MPGYPEYPVGNRAKADIMFFAVTDKVATCLCVLFLNLLSFPLPDNRPESKDNMIHGKSSTAQL